MTVRQGVYHYDYEDKHRERGKKKYLGKTEGTNESFSCL
nr:MAG TPA: hypothetical protein [Siphoviridae sp. ctXG577]